VHFVGLFLSSLLKMHGPKNKTVSFYYAYQHKSLISFKASGQIFWIFLTGFVPFSASSKLFPRATQPPIDWVRRSPFQALKQPKREAGLQLAPMYLLTYNFNHPWVLMVLGLTERTDNVSLTSFIQNSSVV